MSKNNGLQSSSGWGLTSHPTPWTFAMVILVAVILLALLRHFFGSIKVDFSAGSK
jgi:hypothetical protein